MNILGIGEVVVDKTYILDYFIEEDQKSQALGSFYSVGGPVPSGLAFLANMGCDTHFVGAVGKDDLSVFIKNELQKFGIKTSLTHDKKTKINTVIINESKSTRSIVRDSNENKKLSKIDVSLIKNADLIIFDRHEIEAFRYVMKHKKHETKIVFDPSSEYSPNILEMAKYIEYPVFPIETLLQLDDSHIFEKKFAMLFQQLKKTFVVTDGKNGVYTYNGEELIFTESLKVNDIDNDGAGDVFRGAFAYGLLQNWELSKIVDFSIIAGALQCTKIGNLTAVPTKKEVEKYFKTSPQPSPLEEREYIHLK